MESYKKKQLIYAVFAVKTLHKSLLHINGCTADDVIEYVRVLRSKLKPTTKEKLNKGMKNALKNAVKLGLLHTINGRYIPGLQIKEEGNTIAGDPLFHIEQWLLTGTCKFDLDNWIHVNQPDNPESSGHPCLPVETVRDGKKNSDMYVQQWLENSEGKQLRGVNSDMSVKSFNDLETGGVDNTGSGVEIRHMTFSELWLSQHFGKDAIYKEEFCSSEKLMCPKYRRYGKKEVKRKPVQKCTTGSSCVKKKRFIHQTCKVNKDNKQRMVKRKMITVNKKLISPLKRTVNKCQLKHRVARDTTLTAEQTDYYKSVIDDYLPHVTDSNTYLRVQSKLLTLKCKQLRTKYEKPKTKENDSYLKKLNEQIKSAGAMLFLLKKLDGK